MYQDGRDELRERLRRLVEGEDGGVAITRLWNELEPRLEELSEEEQRQALAAVARARLRKKRATGR